jgi:stearoyl-CoA desaturase (delta-9 desaturase)
MKILESSAETLSVIQLGATVLAIAGAFYFTYSITALLTILLGYFLYAGIGISMMYHRYWTHRTFEIHPWLVWLFTSFGILAGRGSIIGWVYIHRLHHKHADTDKDPHLPVNYAKWKSFFPHLMKYGRDMNIFVVRDMLTKTHARIGKYYLGIILTWVMLLAVIDPWLAYFGWIVPVALANFAFNTFLFMGHGEGYENHEVSNSSTNNFVHGYLLWGEGWHNNHHAQPWSYKFGNKWWELDPIYFLIKAIKNDKVS